jgi:opacity protein-like surface antigen
MLRKYQLRKTSFVLDGEAVVLGPDGISDFDGLHSGRCNEEVRLYAFDLLADDGVDTRDETLQLRKLWLGKLLKRSGAGILCPSPARVAATDGSGERASHCRGRGIVRQQNRVGWTVGAGLEKKFTPNWSAKLEYLYVDFGRKTYFGGTANAVDVSFHDHIIRGGFNYAFTAGPVVARY